MPCISEEKCQRSHKIKQSRGMPEWDLNWIPAAGSAPDEGGIRQHFDYTLQDLYPIISPPHVLYMHSNALICNEMHRPTLSFVAADWFVCEYGSATANAL